MSGLAILLALFIMVNVLDRLRLVNWRTTQPRVPVLLLAEFAAGAAGLYQGATEIVCWYVWLAMFAALGILHVTRDAWRRTGKLSVPEEVRTDHGKLDGLTE